LGSQQCGLQTEMRTSTNLRYQPQGDARMLWRRTAFLRHALNRFFDELNFINRIDIDRVDASANSFVEFSVALACTVENDLVGLESSAKCLEEFAAAVDLHIDR